MPQRSKTVLEPSELVGVGYPMLSMIRIPSHSTHQTYFGRLNDHLESFMAVFVLRCLRDDYCSFHLSSSMRQRLVRMDQQDISKSDHRHHDSADNVQHLGFDQSDHPVI